MKLWRSWSSWPTTLWWRTGSMMQVTITGCCRCSVWTLPEVRCVFFYGKNGHFMVNLHSFSARPFVWTRKWRSEGGNAEEVWAFPASRWALPRLSLHSALHGENTILCQPGSRFAHLPDLSRSALETVPALRLDFCLYLYVCSAVFLPTFLSLNYWELNKNRSDSVRLCQSTKWVRLWEKLR